MNKRFRFSGIIHEMASNEILSYIDPEKLEEIRASDPHPLFRAYSLGHEGESRGDMVGVGKVIKRWVKAMIQELANKLKLGTKAFSGKHGKDNSQEGRTVVGELVGKTTKYINGVLHSIGILYIREPYRSQNLDVSSIEAEVDMELTGIGQNVRADVMNIIDVPGIVLADSKSETPGFPGATLRAQIQELTSEGESMDITLEDVKKFIKRERISLSELFGRNDILDDSVVGDIIDDRVTRERNRREAKWRKETDDKIGGAKDDMQTEIDKLTNQLKEANKKLISIDAKKMMVNKMGGRQLTDQQKTFILLDFENKFKVQDSNKLDEELETYLKTGIDEYNKNLEIFSPEAFQKQQEELQKPENTGIIKANEKEGFGDDYTNPENNELIPKD